MPRTESERTRIVQTVEDLGRDTNNRCILVRGEKRTLYVIEHRKIICAVPVAIGQQGMGKTKEGDKKTPIGDYMIKWMVSRHGPVKANPNQASSKIIDGQTFALLDTDLYFGDLSNVRVKTLPNGERHVSDDPQDRTITAAEIADAQGEQLWSDAYGGKDAYVMAINYPNELDHAQGKTGNCIEIHASQNLARQGYKKYKGTAGCISMMPAYAAKVYDLVNPGTPVRIV